MGWYHRKSHGLCWNPHHPALFQQILVPNVVHIFFHGFGDGMPKDRGLDHIGNRERYQGLDQEHIEGDFFGDAAKVCSRSKEPQKEIVVDEVLCTTLVESTVKKERQVSFETKGPPFCIMRCCQ